MELISNCQIIDKPDNVIWILNKQGEFTVSSYYNWIIGKDYNSGHSFPHIQIWKVRIPPGVAFFGWEACRENILTLDKLQKRGLVLANGCFICRKAEETCCHLLLRCPVVYELWCIIYSLLGIHWVSTGSVLAEVRAWRGIHSTKNIVKIIPLAIFWII